jgi:type 1 glutamine amidotransferase
MFPHEGIQKRIALGILAATLAIGGGLQAAEPPAPPRRADVERVFAAARTATPRETSPRPLEVILLADRKDHGEHEHDYPRWQARWALLLGGEAASDERAANLYGPDILAPALKQGAAGVHVTRVDHWPNPDQWAAADLVVAYCYLPWDAKRMREVTKFLERGGGLVVIHSATWTRPKASAEVAEVTGVGGFQRWRHGQLSLQIMKADHAICRGLPANIQWIDEPYWPPTPQVDPKRVDLLVGSHEETEPGQSETALQPQFWTYKKGKGRVFGCVPGHYTWTFDDPFFRFLLLRGIAWAAGEEPYRFDDLVLRGVAVVDE